MNSSRLTPSSGFKPDFNSSILEQSMRINENRNKLKKSLIWGFVNVCFLSIVIYDIMHTCPINTIAFILYMEYLLSAILFLNIVYHFICYINVSLNTAPIIISSQQKQLLGIKDMDSNYTLQTDVQTPLGRSKYYDNTPNASFSNTPMNSSAQSWRSNLSSSFNDSQNYLQSSFSCVRPSLKHAYDHQRSSNVPSMNVTPHDVSTGELINDEQSLSEYLKGYQIYEKATNMSSPVEQPSLLSSFWSHPAAKNNNEIPSVLRRCQYQLSPLSTGTSPSSPTGKPDDKSSPASMQPQGMDLWRRLHVNSSTLTQWNANIRMWLSQTILERLIKEIDFIDDALQKQGLSDVRVGGVGLDRLRKTAQMAPILQFIPTLSTLIPFLELTSNQEYLVKRIRELGKGGCMSDFKWNGGSTFNGKEWNDSLPTDSAIIMHLFLTYMDTQLLPMPNNPDVKPFSGNHYIKCTDKLPELSPNTLAIHQVSEKPPHYRVIVGEEIFEMVKGYNNLFHTLLLFIYQINKKEYGMLGRINFGRSGINILWVIDG